MRAWHMAVLVASAPAFFTVTSTVATFLAPDYSSLSDTMSTLAGPRIPHPWVFQCGVIGYALLIQFLGPLLYQQAGRGWRGVSLWTLVIIYSLAGIMAAVFRNGYDSPLMGHLTESAIHDFVARLSFSGIFLLIVFTPYFLRHQEGWGKWRRFSLVAGLATIALVTLFEADVWSSYIGLTQRVLFGITMLWIFVTALLLRSRLPNRAATQRTVDKCRRIYR